MVIIVFIDVDAVKNMILCQCVPSIFLSKTADLFVIISLFIVCTLQANQSSNPPTIMRPGEVFYSKLTPLLKDKVVQTSLKI